MKIIAFYLPQFHTFPENDKWWGKGFTEWTNTKKGKPNFTGHYQPHTPLNGNYYDLVNDENVLPEQIRLAKEYGVDGFCFYHYWFAQGKKLMEKPIERFLADKSLNMPFCLCWANENWSRRWDGSEQSVLIAQDYGDGEDRKNHIEYLMKFFSDERYLRDEKGRPILLIYKPQLIDNLDVLLAEWREAVMAAGFPGVCFACQYPQNDRSLRDKFDHWIDFEPAATTAIPGDNFLKAFRICPKYAMEVGFTNAFCNLIAIGGGDLRQLIVTGRQLFNIVGLVLGNPLRNRVAVLILDDKLSAGQLFTRGNVNLGDLYPGNVIFHDYRGIVQQLPFLPGDKPELFLVLQIVDVSLVQLVAVSICFALQTEHNVIRNGIPISGPLFCQRYSLCPTKAP